jgi:GTP-binding protein
VSWYPAKPPRPLPQIKARPPTFVAFTRGSEPLPAAAQRFLAAQIRRQFGFQGIPLRITLRHKQPQRQRQRRRP